MERIYVQYGCGLSAPSQWINFDASPTLKLQKTPLIGIILKRQLNITFPNNVKYGDIIKGLPISNNTCDGLYCSHTLEHLSLLDFRKALKNSYSMLKKGGIFRCVVPSLESAARCYIKELDDGNSQASLKFLRTTLLGIEQRPTSLIEKLSFLFGNSNHLWMWDFKSLSKELVDVGFNTIRECQYNDSKDEMFKFVENSGRFENAVAIECLK